MGNPTLPEPYARRGQRSRFKLPVPARLLFTVFACALILQVFILPRYISHESPSTFRLSELHLNRLHNGLQKCRELNTPPTQYDFPTPSRVNPRWNAFTGQKKTVILRNATLFDGKSVVGDVDIEFSKGVIVSVSALASVNSVSSGATLIDLHGKYVTPGLIDMHSHHLAGPWPPLSANDDVNEVNPASGPLTPFVRIQDSIKPDDVATTIIASGGITSSLILPGSANIMGGEGIMVKNLLRSGPNGEEVVEELLLEHGVPHAERRRFMKMACGENPRKVYHHTRMGNAWTFRHHMERAKELMGKQDEWCAAAAVAGESGDDAAIAALLNDKGGLPEELELESSVAMLRGKIGINVHCYEPEDFEDMLLHSKEFKFRIQAFHHALSAWKVPELLKDSEENITVATFSTFGFYKKEAYEANLWAGKVLSDHGVPVAYKSDHGDQMLNAKYLLFQAATAHSFHLPHDLALQSVTSVPAKSLALDHRIGYVRPGYDADIVVWDSHPLSLGATPLQVYIDGRATLDPSKVEESLPSVSNQKAPEEPKMRLNMAPDVRNEACNKIDDSQSKVVITGITKSYVHRTKSSLSNEKMTLVLEAGELVCFDTPRNCLSSAVGGQTVDLQNGHVLPGLTAVTTALGMFEISAEDRTSDGTISRNSEAVDPESVVYAKHGIHLEGRSFQRARMGGITRAISAPISGGFQGGVSVGFKTSGKQTILDGGIFKDDVALHFTLGQRAKGDSTPTVSSAVEKLRRILVQNKGKDNIYGNAEKGRLPVVVHAENKVSCPFEVLSRP